MTIDIQEASRIYQAGVNVGRTMAKHEAEEFTKLAVAFVQHGATAPVAKAAMPPKSPVVARSATKASTPRVKGVKEAIVKLIGESSDMLTTGDIIAKTGHKKSSVRATLMSMKKAGQTFQEGPHWFLMRPVGDGNSEAEIRSEY